MGMGWVCRHRQHGAVLALIALALQIAVAFSHVHLHALAQSPHASAQRAALADAKSRAPAQIPADNDDYCAICASIFLTSSAFAPAPPQLLVPANFHRVRALLPCREPPRRTAAARFPLTRSARGLRLRSLLTFLLRRVPFFAPDSSKQRGAFS